jgi:hypothetical protein
VQFPPFYVQREVFELVFHAGLSPPTGIVVTRTYSEGFVKGLLWHGVGHITIGTHSEGKMKVF